ncbi:Rha family transcriptional regulator [Lentilactobacillus hilgardii]|uniref:Rha family transcriptional regulator n=1 Tax=Lentilactobacillus hilgardii TaxID=1588 RepID=UPI0021C3CEEB|nr:Rha family transcriptional regulator [Lentilactobacillus hilgardii]MCP9331890.1 Rha family transcriptional regulator [Lentilactobacillus hilgardii]MCP9348457.1 Rha family transcriptional regulator [Lentilactobacillus hilgardii]MCP9351305.1 Rha family transcriptional regulator [Lentilactobacillus hilgardii]
MNNLVIMKNKQAVTSSLQVAETFGKNHRDVLRAITNLQKDVRNFAQMFIETNIPDSYGRDRKAFYMNRDGFTLLAMGFTGNKALEFKLKYIDAFNTMEQSLKQIPRKKLDPVLQAELAITNAKTRKANALFRIAKATKSDSAKQALLAKAAEAITGEMTIPAMQQKEYSAGEVGKKLGISGNMVGRIAKRIGIKAEQPGKNEYGRWSNSKSQYSDKEVPQWLYFDKGLQAVKSELSAV